FSILNPSYSSDFVASLSQPLLRGAGLDVNANPIRLAFYDLQASEARTKLEIIRVLADADRVFWRLYAARQELTVRKQEYDLAVARNGTLPLVSLDYTYSVNGLGGTFSQSFAQVDDANFQDHRVGLRLELPLGNAAARARLRRAILSRIQRLTTREQRALQIRQ